MSNCEIFGSSHVLLRQSDRELLVSACVVLTMKPGGEAEMVLGSDQDLATSCFFEADYNNFIF